MSQKILPFIPGYYWNGYGIESTGAAISPTQHINYANGEVRYYVKPIGWPCGVYIRHAGILDWLRDQEY